MTRFAVFTRSRRDVECATHGTVPRTREGCMKCGAGSVASRNTSARDRGVTAGGSSRASSWLHQQAAALDVAAQLDPAAVHAGRMAAQARAMAALAERSADDATATDTAEDADDDGDAAGF